jgi:uncharacterized protein YndB with AHSA1/START domain
MPNSVHLHRVLAARPDKVYRAFLEPDALAKWLSPNGFACTVHKLEPAVGGSYSMSFRNFTTSQSHSFSGKYIELIPNQRLRYVDRFDDPNLTGEIQVTVTLRPVGRHRAEHRAGRPAGHDSGGGVLSWLAGLAPKSRQTCRARHQSLNSITSLKFKETSASAARIRIEEALRSLRGEPRNREFGTSTAISGLSLTANSS